MCIFVVDGNASVVWKCFFVSLFVCQFVCLSVCLFVCQFVFNAVLEICEAKGSRRE